MSKDDDIGDIVIGGGCLIVMISALVMIVSVAIKVARWALQ